MLDGRSRSENIYFDCLTFKPLVTAFSISFMILSCRERMRDEKSFTIWLAKVLKDRGGVLKDVLGHDNTFEVICLGLEGQVHGLGLEASSLQKLPCPRLEDSIIF